ncbi:MAG: HAMP domain-containing histidine kinase, partial [Deltaproteobacteria bacterium]|nr:HAMP domain-containing histidine kinase [Deltaproteobacteria bacterium]
RLSNAFYQQNVDANRIYEQIQTKRPQKAAPLPTGLVSVRLGPFAWESLNLHAAGELAMLAAVRSVATPDGALLQAFVVDPHKVAATLFDDPGSGSVRPQQTAATTEAVAPLPLTVKGRAWEVAIALGPEAALAETLAAEVVSDFVLRASVITAVVLLAALAIILSMISAERTIERRQQFAAAAAHELRTPLAGLRMYAEMLADGLGRPEKQKAYAERLSSEAARLGRVVTNVLDFARLERQSLVVKPAPGDLAAAVTELARRLEPAVQAHGATLVVDRSQLAHPDAPLMARFDADALAQIVGNLVDNAEKYTRTSADRRIEIVLRETPRGPELAVRDHGPGLPPALRKGQFRAFRRGTPKDGPAGLGLGLALTRALARAQGGDLIVAPPSTGPGAELLVTLSPA